MGFKREKTCISPIFDMILQVALKINRREKRYELAAMREIKTIVTLHKQSGGKW